MTRKLVSVCVAGVATILPFVATVQLSAQEVFAQWNFADPAYVGKGIDEVAAIGTVGAGNVFSGNFEDSSIDDAARGYSIKRNGPSSNVYAPTGITVLDQESMWLIIDFAGWNLPLEDAVNLNFDAANDPATGNYPAAAFRLLSSAGSDRVRLQVYGVGGFQGQQELGIQEDGVTIALNLNQDSYEVTLYCKTAGGQWLEVATAPQFGRNDRKIGAVKIVENGPLGGDYSADIKSITVTSESPVPGA